MLKFIRFRGDIINLDNIEDVIYMKVDNITKITYKNNNFYKYVGGDYRDDIWQLMRLALRPTDIATAPEQEPVPPFFPACETSTSMENVL